jgi:hypothetical protein
MNFWRIILVLLVLAAVIFLELVQFGCTSAPVKFAPLVTSEININDSANGNTVPLVGP